MTKLLTIFLFLTVPFYKCGIGWQTNKKVESWLYSRSAEIRLAGKTKKATIPEKRIVASW